VNQYSLFFALQEIHGKYISHNLFCHLHLLFPPFSLYQFFFEFSTFSIKSFLLPFVYKILAISF